MDHAKEPTRPACSTCNGTGRVLAPGGSGYSSVQCPDCHGTGRA